MKSALETLSPTRVKLTVEVPFEELKPSLDAAIKHIGEHIQVPGFRRGKVPARIIEQRVGRAAVLEEAVNNALPELYGKALEENSVRPLGQPEITDLKVPATDGEDFSFIAEVDRRPDIELPDFSDLELTVDEATVSDDDVARTVEQMREQQAAADAERRSALQRGRRGAARDGCRGTFARREKAARCCLSFCARPASDLARRTDVRTKPECAQRHGRHRA